MGHKTVENSSWYPQVERFSTGLCPEQTCGRFRGIPELLQENELNRKNSLAELWGLCAQERRILTLWYYVQGLLQAGIFCE